MKTLKIKRLHPDAVIPEFATPGSAGLDLTAVSLETVKKEGVTYQTMFEWPADQKYVYGTGLAFEIPEGHVGLIFPRSSIHKTGMQLTNCVGVIDSDYRGEVKFVFNLEHDQRPTYQVGDRVGQLVIVELPNVAIEEVLELSATVRGTGGFGSTGR